MNPDPRAGSLVRIRSAFTADGSRWVVEEGNRVTPPPQGAAALGVADPAPVQLPGGSRLMALKSFIAPVQPGVGQPGRRPQPQGLQAHVVGSATSSDGLNWVRDEGIRIAAASVPAAINDSDERVLLYFVRPSYEPGKPENMACVISTDGLIHRPEPDFRIEDISTLKAVDPSVVRDDEGRFRLYYLASHYHGDPARGPNPHAIHLAVSEDVVRFREVGPVFEYPDLVDPDVFRFGDSWRMFDFAAGRTIIAQSEDGYRFEYRGILPLPGWGTTAPVLLPDGRLRLYAFDQRAPAGNVVRSFVSEEGLPWLAETGERLQARPDEQITDPFVIPWRSGYRMYFKIQPARPVNPGLPTVP